MSKKQHFLNSVITCCQCLCVLLMVLSTAGMMAFLLLMLKYIMQFDLLHMLLMLLGAIACPFAGWLFLQAGIRLEGLRNE